MGLPGTIGIPGKTGPVSIISTTFDYFMRFFHIKIMILRSDQKVNHRINTEYI